MSLIISPVDSGQLLQSPVDSGNLLQSLVDSGTTLQKPSGFSQNSYEARWIPAQPSKSRVDSRKSRVDSRKSRVDSRKSPVDSGKLLSKAEWILANVYQKPSGFSRMFIKSRVDSRKRLPCFKLLVLNNGPLELTF